LEWKKVRLMESLKVSKMEKLKAVEMAYMMDSRMEK